ncbi:MAG: hypothetical protein AAEC03_10915 [Synechococcus sp.]
MAIQLASSSGWSKKRFINAQSGVTATGEVNLTVSSLKRDA